jgi:hypothetical protein
MLGDPVTVLCITYPPIVYVSISSHSLRIIYPPLVMLAAPLTVLRIMYRPVVYANSYSHSFNYKLSTSSLC